ncbi:MAG: penicillin acylase family protein, partial [Nitrosomonas sp.]|nr:penicillin acylase family protein [Nitrosomonas sp.]
MTFIVRLIRHSFIFVLLIALLLVGIAWLLLRGSMPQYTGEARISNLTSAVTIERDALGTATIHAQNHHDLIRALGFVHAQERFFEMDLMRRRAAGELAELFGTAALPADRIARSYRMRTRVSTLLTQLPRHEYDMLNAYQQGVNNGLQALAVRPFPYLLTQSQPNDWKMEDSLLVVMAMYFMLNDSSKYREIDLSIMKASLPASVYQFLTANGGQWDAPLQGTPATWPSLPTADEINLQTLEPELQPHDYQQNGNMPGSNSFAVSSALTHSGALVANDMHLELKVPSIWFRTRLIYPDSKNSDQSHDITGVSLPGMPAIIVGSNRHIAWSFTNSYGDFADWVRVTLDPHEPARYLSSMGWQPLTTYHETLQVKDAPDEQIIVLESEWGPILAKDFDGTPLALAWTALRSNAINLKLAEL